MADFRLPDLGEGLAEAEIVHWLVKVGDEVVIDQPVVEVETAKASIEVPVPFAGTVTQLHGEEGQVLTVGSPLISVGEHSEPGRTSPTTSPREGFREPGVVTADPSLDADAVASSGSGNVLIGYGTAQDRPRRRRRSAVSGQVNADAATAPAASIPTVAAEPIPEPASSVSLSSMPPGVISPVVRRLARDGGLDLATVHGTGPHGIVCRRDVEVALTRKWNSDTETVNPALPADSDLPTDTDLTADTALPPSTSPTAAAAGSAAAESGGLADRIIPMTGTKKFVADKLSQSRREIPEATVWVDIDVTELVVARRRLTSRERPISILALLSRFVVAGLRRFPELNARVEGDQIVQSGQINLGFAAATDRGLVVPVVHGAQSLTLSELALAMRERIDQARSGRLDGAALRGGTFTVNNYGVFGVDGSAAIINHPEAAILGIGRIIERPWVVDGEIVVRQVSQLTISFDHRVCDGTVAGGFLRYVADCLECPVSALADL